MNNLDETIGKYYRNKSLSPEKVDLILSRTRAYQKKSLGRYYKFAAMAAVLLIGLIGFHQNLNRSNLTERVLAEVAMNHLKQLNVEVASDRYEVIEKELDRLDFSISPVKSYLPEKHTLIGGRYCSIHGGLAAQLKVRDTITGEIVTVYVTKLTEALEDLTPLDTDFDGVRIRFRKENGRFLAIAGSKGASQ